MITPQLLLDLYVGVVGGSVNALINIVYNVYLL